MIRVIVDDLARTHADAVVRPTDQSLEPMTPAIARLDRQAGPRFAEQRKLARPLQAGSAVVTGSGELTAPFVLHVVVRDTDSAVGRDVVRRALISAWQRAADWELKIIAAPLVGPGAESLSLEEWSTLLAETFPSLPEGSPSQLYIVVEQDAERELVESIVRRFA